MSADRVYESTCGAFAELVAHGVEHAIVSPGSRSTPLAVAAEWTEGLTVTMHLDERSAGFYGLGLAKATERPVVLVCTSGTAAANYLPAVIEAHYSGVPLIVFTADRPAELRDWGAGQTIDQVELYGNHVRWSAELAVAGEVDPRWFRRMATRAVVAATDPDPGPVHLNWPLREPLEPSGRPSVARRATLAVTTEQRGPTAEDIARLNALTGHERGVIISGPANFDAQAVEAVAEFASRTGWPIIAEPASQLRFGPHIESAPVIAGADQLCRNLAWSRQHAPQVVVRIGDSPTCKPVRLWLESNPPDHHILIDPHRRWNDASFTATEIIAAPVAELFAATSGGCGETRWTKSWTKSDRDCSETIDRALKGGPLLEALIARSLAATLPSDSVLYVSNSMPVRDLDTFAAAATSGPRVLVNRGASGIDGLISCADGVASTGTPTALLIGDIATLHDAGGLLHAARFGHNLTIVIPNNDGGGIFSFLPIASNPDTEFETLFGTPHGTDLAQLGQLSGARHQLISHLDDFEAAVKDCVARDGVDIIEIPIELEDNLAQHRAVASAVAETLLS